MISTFVPIGCRSRMSLFICINLKDSKLCPICSPTAAVAFVAGKSAALHLNELDCVACRVNEA